MLRRPEMFGEAAAVLRQFGLMGENELASVEALALRCAQAAQEGAQEEEVGMRLPCLLWKCLMPICKFAVV
jgi:hypothetical protein